MNSSQNKSRESTADEGGKKSRNGAVSKSNTNMTSQGGAGGLKEAAFIHAKQSRNYGHAPNVTAASMSSFQHGKH
jgi:hypothetical protein